MSWSILFVISSNILQVTQTSLVFVQLNALKTVQDEMLYQDRIYCVKTVCDQSIIRLISYKNCFDRIGTASTSSYTFFHFLVFFFFFCLTSLKLAKNLVLYQTGFFFTSKKKSISLECGFP